MNDLFDVSILAGMRTREIEGVYWVHEKDYLAAPADLPIHHVLVAFGDTASVVDVAVMNCAEKERRNKRLRRERVGFAWGPCLFGD